MKQGPRIVSEIIQINTSHIDAGEIYAKSPDLRASRIHYQDADRGDVNRTFDFETEPRTKQRNVTPLMMASGYGDTPIVELLLRRGADPARVDGDGNRALDYALTGTLYRATLFECQDSTVRALVAAHAPLVVHPDSRKWAKFKRCNGLALLR